MAGDELGRLKSPLTPLLNPKSVAVIGASDKTGRIGFVVVNSLVQGGFPGPIFPVNPRLTRLLDMPAYPSIEDISDEVDLAIIVLRRELVLQAMEACGRKGVKAVIVMSSGFSELGDLETEEKLAAKAKQYGIRFLGPNCAGYAAPWENVYASFENRVQQGHLGFISQSGAMCAVFLALARAESLGLSMFVSYGNAADVGPDELLKYLEKHRPSHIITGYLEGLVPRQARQFLSAARSITPHKPILILKPGNTSAGTRAIASHTGALAGEQAIYSGAFRQAGILQANTLYEFIDASKTLTTLSLPAGDRVAIMTNSGGPGVLAVDACARAGLTVPPFSSTFMKQLQTTLPPSCSVDNPVDVGPEGNEATYQQMVQLLLANDETDIVLVVCVPPAFSDIRAITKAVIAAKRTRPSKPLATCWMAGDIVAESLPLLEKASIPNFPTPQRAATALSFLVQRARWLDRQPETAQPIEW
jgi:acyl-CoA synthetase (NDP forming)